MYFYCYVYVFLFLSTFCSVYSVSLCCSVYCLFVNVYLYYCHRVSTQFQLTNISYIISRKVGRCVGLTTLPLACAECLEILGTWNSWRPKDLSRPVKGLVYLFMRSGTFQWGRHIAGMGVMRNVQEYFIGNPEQIRPLWRSRLTWEDNIKCFLKT
jgi:hypothetical protein